MPNSMMHNWKELQDMAHDYAFADDLTNELVARFGWNRKRAESTAANLIDERESCEEEPD